MRNCRVDNNRRKNFRAKQLQMVCHRAELGQILQSNNVSFHLLDTILANERQFSKFLMYLVQQEAPLDELIKNAKKVSFLFVVGFSF